jgi:hypothetical protein
MAEAEFHWVVSPDALVDEIEEYGERALAAVHAVAAWWGQRCQDGARRDARWEDRTGNARSGLFFAVDGFGMPTITGSVPTSTREALGGDVTVEQGKDDLLIITLGHTMYYGRFLELAMGGQYAVIMSTIERNLPTLERTLQQLLK